MAEFFFELIDYCAVFFPVFALVALLLGCRDEALELAALGAVALGLALGRRWE